MATESMEIAKESKKKITITSLIGRFGALFGLTFLVIFLSITSDVFLSSSNLSNIARQATVNAFLSVGLLLAIITAGIDLSVGSVLALSMCTLAILAIKMGVNPYLAILACLAMGTFFGWINGLLLTKLHLPHPFIATLGTQNIARGLALIITDSSPVSGFDRAGAPEVLTLGAGSVGPIPVAFIAVFVVYILFHILLTRTPFGRHIYAVGGNVSAARLSGINVSRTLMIVYSLSGFLAGLAALMLAGRTNSGFPNAGVGYETDAIAAVIIGGASFAGGSGTIGGTAIGVLMIAVLRNGLVLLNVPTEWQTVAIGLVIIGAVSIDMLRHRAQQ
ncbi:MAG: ribose transport system permease protein [Chloroflexota bacterium]|nr:ribose transport system permease protein [Chloroflexota bacterium]